MRISLDFANMMASNIGEIHGINEEELNGLRTRAEEIDRYLREKRKGGELPFFDLPYQKEEVSRILRTVRGLKGRFENFVVLGIGGSALGAKALFLALSHPQHNLLPKRKRNGALRLFIADNIDPEGFQALLDILDLKKTVFNVISKSGGTAEVISQFLVVRELLRQRLGPKGYRSNIIIYRFQKRGLTGDYHQGVIKKLCGSGRSWR